MSEIHRQSYIFEDNPFNLFFAFDKSRIVFIVSFLGNQYKTAVRNVFFGCFNDLLLGIGLAGADYGPDKRSAPSVRNGFYISVFVFSVCGFIDIGFLH